MLLSAIIVVLITWMMVPLNICYLLDWHLLYLYSFGYIISKQAVRKRRCLKEEKKRKEKERFLQQTNCTQFNNVCIYFEVLLLSSFKINKHMDMQTCIYNTIKKGLKIRRLRNLRNLLLSWNCSRMDCYGNDLFKEKSGTETCYSILC